MEKEIWKDIKGYEGLYQISNFGNVKSLERKTKCKNGYRKIKEKLLKQSKNSWGYKIVNLSKNNKTKIYTVHRLVLNNFICDSNLTVNHKDENKNNNNLKNLEYMTLKENSRYSKCKKILQFDKQNNFIKEWISICDIERELNIFNSNITACCKNKRKSAGGYIWRYKNGFINWKQ